MPIAFFDFDGTLINTSSAKVSMLEFYRRGELSLMTLIEGTLWGLGHFFNLADGEKMFIAGLRAVAGFEEERLRSLLEEVFEKELISRIYIEGLEAIKMHKERGDEVAILSSSPEYLLNLYAEFAGIENVICSKNIVKNGIMTREVVKPICYGEGKVFWANKFVEERGLTWEGSHYYTDSHSDLPMLVTVENPICVNPDIRLRLEARKRGWTVAKYRETLSQKKP
ncbi:MAG: HAD family hydrolase [Myxococcota bacterium]